MPPFFIAAPVAVNGDKLNQRLFEWRAAIFASAA
jgi:hypothetical protein